MFKCKNCGCVFGEEEMRFVNESHGFNDGFYERIEVCPNCGCDGCFEEMGKCEDCGEYFEENDLFGCFCIDCLKEEITYQSALEFMERDCCDSLDIFMFESVFEVDCPKKRSEKMDKHLKEVYMRFVADEKLRRTDVFLKKAQDFILNYDGDYGKENFADFIIEKRKAVKQ